jgi:hypothetical protein
MSTNDSNFGLISSLDNGASLIDLEMKNCSLMIIGRSIIDQDPVINNFGFFVGSSSGTIDNCKSIDNTIIFGGYSNNVGGIVGLVTDGNIEQI